MVKMRKLTETKPFALTCSPECSKKYNRHLKDG